MAPMEVGIHDFAKYCMLVLLLMPFVALLTDAAGKTHGMMLKVAEGVVAASWIVIWLIGDFERRPNVALVFALAWVAWPLALLTAKGWNPGLSWGSLWMSALLMSWYHANMAVLLDGEGGLGAGLALLLGWAYMIVPFGTLSMGFLAGRECVRVVLELIAGRVGAATRGRAS